MLRNFKKILKIRKELSDMKKQSVIAIILISIIILSGCQFKDYSKQGLETTKQFYQNINNGDFNKAKEYVVPVLKPSIQEMGRKQDKINLNLKFKNLKYKLLKSSDKGVQVRVYYKLFVKNPVENKAHQIIMDVSLIPVEGEGLKIAQFDEVSREKIET